MPDRKTLFDLPTDPDGFSVLLPPSELRNIDFSALEFSTARRAVIEYIKMHFPDDFNDFVSNNGIIMLVELLSYLTAVLSMRSDLLANEAFLPTAKSEEAVQNHLALLGQKIKRPTPAVVDVECSVSSPVGSDIRIPPGQRFYIAGDDGREITYEVYKAPNDIINDIVIPSGKRGVIAHGVEGRTETTTVISDGSADQVITINVNESVIEEPIRVETEIDGIIRNWHQISNIERAGADERAYEVRLFDDRIEFIFGDDITGRIPQSGSEISMTYRVGGGVRGRIGSGQISLQRPFQPDPPFTAPVSVTFRNVTPSSGGMDKETISQAKKRAPRVFATHNSAITESDYAELARAFNHPIFGAVAKAIATVRTGLNANRVELHVLAEGVNGPVAPNNGLKKALENYLDDINTLTDHVVAKDGSILPVDVEMTVVMSKSADASVIKAKTDQAIEDFFDIRNWDMGQPLFVSQLYDLIMDIDGVKYIDIFKPQDNILATGEVDSDEFGVDINEIITLGNTEVRYYYETLR